MEIEQTTTKGPAFAPAHPGEILREDVLPELGISKAAFAEHIGVSRNTLYKLINEDQPVTLDIALRLGKALGNGARFWLALQMQHDIWTAEREGRITVKPLMRSITGGGRAIEKETLRDVQSRPSAFTAKAAAKVAAAGLTAAKGASKPAAAAKPHPKTTAKTASKGPSDGGRKR